MREIAEEAEIGAVEGGAEAVEEQPAEQPRQRPDGEKEVGAPRDPSGAVEGESAARHDAMDVRVMGQRLSPGVRIAKPPIFAASRRGSAASVVMASTALLNSIA